MLSCNMIGESSCAEKDWFTSCLHSLHKSLLFPPRVLASKGRRVLALSEVTSSDLQPDVVSVTPEHVKFKLHASINLNRPAETRGSAQPKGRQTHRTKRQVSPTVPPSRVHPKMADVLRPSVSTLGGRARWLASAVVLGAPRSPTFRFRPRRRKPTEVRATGAERAETKVTRF